MQYNKVKVPYGLHNSENSNVTQCNCDGPCKPRMASHLCASFSVCHVALKNTGLLELTAGFL
jgi:hypothetical protein